MLIRKNGKLLLTGEYAVMNGGLGLALPTKLGQSLKITSIEDGKAEIHWISRDEKNEVWFEAQLNYGSAMDLLKSSDDRVGMNLRKMLMALFEMNRKLADSKATYQIFTKLEFPRDWGLGSSSTLVSALSEWAGVDAYQLLEKTMGGSGYDLACANVDYPILYKRKLEDETWVPDARKVQFSPSFKPLLYFVHLGKKQDSREGIKLYNFLTPAQKESLVQELTIITRAIVDPDLTFNDFERILDLHESTVSKALHIPRVRDLYFKDFGGQVKSLGAWGGDFIMATAHADDKAVRAYFKSKGFDVVLGWQALFY